MAADRGIVALAKGAGRRVSKLYRGAKALAVEPKFSPAEAEALTRRFHQLFYQRGLHGTAQYRGIRMIKCPLDMWIVRELIERIRPNLIIETGTYQGASALYYGDLLDDVGHGRIVTIDIHPIAHYLDAIGRRGADATRHPRATYLVGSSSDAAIIKQVAAHVRPGHRVMAFLDSDHSQAHVAAEIEVYAPFVSVGSYLVVEDTNVNGHPVRAGHGPGPMEAVDAFLGSPMGRGFQRDPSCERYLITMNPGGWLKRVA